MGIDLVIGHVESGLTIGLPPYEQILAGKAQWHLSVTDGRLRADVFAVCARHDGNAARLRRRVLDRHHGAEGTSQEISARLNREATRRLSDPQIRRGLPN